MQIQMLLILLSLICLLGATFTTLARVNLGWLGMSFFVASFLIRT